MPSLSLVSINIEGSKHLDLVVPFLSKIDPDIVCVQELYESDAPAISKALNGAPHVFAPKLRDINNGKPDIEGMAIFSRPSIYASASHYYHHAEDERALFDKTDIHTMDKTESCALLLADCKKDGTVFRIMTTHFTWSPDGSTSDLQRRDMNALLEILGSCGEFVLAGDFNAPRVYKGEPGEIFAMLSSKYKDNIPPHHETSIDGSIHRAGALPYMVDGLFTTPRYAASRVELHTGVSDHCAITATISTVDA